MSVPTTPTKYSDLDRIQDETDVMRQQIAALTAAGLTSKATYVSSLLTALLAQITDATALESSDDTLVVRRASDGSLYELTIDDILSPLGGGDMMKATYDPNNDGIIAPAQGGSGASLAAIITSNTTIVSGTHKTVIVDTTSAAVTATLPASPANGDSYRFKLKKPGANDGTVARNGNTIDGAASDYALSVNAEVLEVQFVTGYGWAIV